MSRETIREPRNQWIMLFIGVCMLFGLMSAFLIDAPAVEVPPALAVTACATANPTCPPPDDTKTSSMHVKHEMRPPSTNKVQPDDGESWEIKAYWNSAAHPCAERTETASVDVQWNGSIWVLANETTTTNIIDIDLCPTGEVCTSGVDTYSYGYRLIADVTDPVVVGARAYNLRKVEYQLDTVDDGYELTLSTCSLGTSVSYDTSIDGGVDHGPFLVARCPFDCEEPVGSSVTITYE